MRSTIKHAVKAIVARRRGDLLGAAGSATIEFALVASVLLFLALGIADFGVMFNNYQALAAATRIGAEYARDNPTCQSTATGINTLANPPVGASCVTGIQSAISNSIYFPASTLSFPSSGACANNWPGVICQCDDGNSIACDQTCASQNPPRPTPNRVFVAVCTNQKFTPLVLWGGALELQSTAELRICCGGGQ
jgi:Flp pilus assembly protein TadG